ncbi:MAG: TetR/AcrR family transcriptional regulator C-terminal domain-containing protein [Pseudomonadota bacterium]
MSAEPNKLGRPQLVDRAKILEAAIAIGLDNLSMHKVARYLNVSATSLYRYVDSKDALMQACMDEFCSRISQPNQDLRWDEYLSALSDSFNEALMATPGAHAYGTQLGPTTAAAYAIIDGALSHLLSAGFSHRLALTAYNLIVDHAFVLAAKRERTLEVADSQDQQGYQILRETEHALAPYPALTATLAAVLPPDFNDTTAVDTIIEGIRVKLGEEQALG